MFWLQLSLKKSLSTTPISCEHLYLIYLLFISLSHLGPTFLSSFTRKQPDLFGHPSRDHPITHLPWSLVFVAHISTKKTKITWFCPQTFAIKVGQWWTVSQSELKYKKVISETFLVMNNDSSKTLLIVNILWGIILCAQKKCRNLNCNTYLVCTEIKQWY